AGVGPPADLRDVEDLLLLEADRKLLCLQVVRIVTLVHLGILHPHRSTRACERRRPAYGIPCRGPARMFPASGASVMMRDSSARGADAGVRTSPAGVSERLGPPRRRPRGPPGAG